MSPKSEAAFREPTELERRLLERLLEADFPGRDELAPLLRSVLVRTIDEDGGLELKSQTEGKARVVQKIPVEAEGKDADGVVIHMLLHVIEGRPVELEFFREDAKTVKTVPPPSSFEVIVHPPMPNKGWFAYQQIVMDGKNWIAPDDVYDSFFRAVGAPSWHGRNFNALRDSIAVGKINKIEVPYFIRIKNYSVIGSGAKGMASDFIQLIRELQDSGCPVGIEVEN